MKIDRFPDEIWSCKNGFTIDKESLKKQ